MDKITLCGDNCNYCPRYLAKTDAELSQVAQLWYKIGWRETIVTNEEIQCFGCSSHKKCTYGLVECIKEQGVAKCNQCKYFACEKISQMLKCSSEYKLKCEKICTEEENQMLEKSFFKKEENLRK